VRSLRASLTAFASVLTSPAFVESPAPFQSSHRPPDRYRTATPGPRHGGRGDRARSAPHRNRTACGGVDGCPLTS